MLFPPPFLTPDEKKRRKQEGNWLSTTVSLYYQSKPCNHSAGKTTNLFITDFWSDAFNGIGTCSN